MSRQRREAAADLAAQAGAVQATVAPQAVLVSFRTGESAADDAQQRVVRSA